MDLIQSFSARGFVHFKAIRCTLPSCRCDCFSPGKTHLRTCDTCKHGWVAHALDKLGYRSMYQLGMHVEVVQANMVFDIASLMLYGAQATPIRLKILLDRLFSVLQHEEVLQVLHGFGWTYEDYARGYILQESSGRVLDKWSLATRDEEQVIIQQFLRFGETKSIAQEIILQDTRENRERTVVQTPKTESEIKKFIERSNMSMTGFMPGFDPRHLLSRPLNPATTPPTTLITPQVTTTTNSTGSVSGSNTVTTRIMSPSGGLSTFSPPPARGPSSNPEVPGGGVIPAVSPGDTGSPLTRLQGMQPFDYRRERLSPTVSPGTGSEKSLALSSSGNKTPEDLSMGAISSASTPPATTPVAFTMQVNPIQVTPTKPESSDEMSCYAGGAASDDSQDGVINYSTKGMSSSSVYADRKIKHLRKSANPMKRHWQPNPTFGSTLISPSGKKRVLCTACNKTFCDKGALKIHYSAVHLKEMHKCTVEGCNMMFSSRRSRNRHSANPNPKLHMPNQKRKIPDGVTLVDDKGNTLSLSSSITPSPSLSMNAPSSMSPVAHAAEVKQVVPKTEPGMGHELAMVPPEIGFYMDPTVRMPILIPSPVKVPKMDPLPPTTCVLAPAAHTPEAYCANIKREPMMGSRSSRKRKSAVPTRCAQLEEMYVMSDDDGATSGETATEENLMPQNLTVPKHTDKGSSSNSKLESHRSEDQSDDQPFDGNNGKCMSGHCNTDDESRDGMEDTKKDLRAHAKNFEGFSLTTFHDIQAQAIKQMDCISQARLRDVCNDDFPKENDSNNNGDGAADDDNDTNTDGIVITQNSTLDSERTNESGPSSPMSPNNGSSDLESLDSGGEGSPSHLNGYSGKEYIIDMGDIPLDSENPRRCTACGKIFPNHAGVKAHYQNVHLSRTHTCTVEGCNAAFPSKRSRDRHSSNLNLHRKLLSTSSSDSEGKSTSKPIHEEYMPRIYSDGFAGSHPYNSHHYDVTDEADDNNLVINMSTRTTDANMNNSGKDGYGGSTPPHSLTNGDSPSHQVDDGYNDFDSQEDSPLPADHEGMVKCHICRQRFRDNLVLKEHYEKTHPKEMYRCTISGCDKIFSTRKSRNRHSQNDNLHRHLSPTTNGTP